MSASKTVLFGAVLIGAFLLTVPAMASIVLSDGPGGMTCRFFADGGKMRWQQEGGDWIDANGEHFGDHPFAVVDVPAGRGRQIVRWDITSLMQDWLAADAKSGAVFLSTVPAARTGSVEFGSRESVDENARPKLVLTYTSSSTLHVDASADTHLNCTTSRSTGQGTKLKVGQGQNAIIVFPLDDVRPDGLVKAELVLASDKQFRAGASVVVFRPLLPSDQDRPSEAGLAQAFVGDRGIESHPAVVFVDRFESASWASGWSSVSKGSTTERMPKDWEGAIDGSALKVTVPEGKTNGLNGNIRFGDKFGGEPEAMYFRYLLRFGNDWDPSLSGGKLPGFAGTYNRAGWGGRKANGENGWSARGAFFKWKPDPIREDNFRGIGSYVYHAGMTGTYGSQWGWNLGRTGMLEKNRWYSIEQYVQLNNPGQHNGVLKAWVDGELVFERTDLRYRDVSDLKIETLWMNVYHGGTTPAPHDMSLYIDNLVISREYIGPFRKAP